MLASLRQRDDLMQRRRFVAFAASTVSASVAGCFGTNTGPGREETNLEPGGNGPRTVSNELENRLTITDENLLAEDGQVTFSLRFENITDEAVTVDVAVTMLDDDGNAISDQYVERALTVEAEDSQTVSFDIAEGPDEVANYRVEVTEADAGDDEEDGTGDNEEDGTEGGDEEPANGEDDAATGTADESAGDGSTP
jgi:hypothetical protein